MPCTHPTRVLSLAPSTGRSGTVICYSRSVDPLMQDYSELVAHPTGTLESIAVSSAVNTLTRPERHGSAPRREYCPGKRTVSLTAGPYRYRVVPSGQRMREDRDVLGRCRACGAGRGELRVMGRLGWASRCALLLVLAV